MKCNTGLLVPISAVALASGISIKILKKDIENSLLYECKKGYVWYRDAMVYVFQKWNDGKVDMYPPYSEDPDNSFAARVLSLMDDNIAVNNLRVEWKDRNDSTI